MNGPVLTYQFEPSARLFAEMDEVRLTEALELPGGGVIPAGAEGTVLGVWADGAAYEVEFDIGLATAEATILEPAD